MAEFRQAVLTDAGRTLLSKTQISESGVTLTRAEIGKGTYAADENLTTAASLKSPEQEYSFLAKRVIEKGTVQLRFIVSNNPPDGTPLIEGFYMTEIGVYALDGDDEILYAIAAAYPERADWLPSYDGQAATTITVNIQIAVANAEQVTLTSVGGTYATNEDLELLQDSVIPKADIAQNTGTSTEKVMSQKAVTDALEEFETSLDEANIMRVTAYDINGDGIIDEALHAQNADTAENAEKLNNKTESELSVSYAAAAGSATTAVNATNAANATTAETATTATNLSGVDKSKIVLGTQIRNIEVVNELPANPVATTLYLVLEES